MHSASDHGYGRDHFAITKVTPGLVTRDQHGDQYRVVQWVRGNFWLVHYETGKREAWKQAHEILHDLYAD